MDYLFAFWWDHVINQILPTESYNFTFSAWWVHRQSTIVISDHLMKQMGKINEFYRQHKSQRFNIFLHTTGKLILNFYDSTGKIKSTRCFSWKRGSDHHVKKWQRSLCIRFIWRGFGVSTFPSDSIVVGVIQIRGWIFAIIFEPVFRFDCFKAMDLVRSIFNFISIMDIHKSLSRSCSCKKKWFHDSYCNFMIPNNTHWATAIKICSNCTSNQFLIASLISFATAYM